MFVDDPFIIDDKLEQDFVVSGGQLDLSLKAAIYLVEPLGLAPIVEGASDVNMVSLIWPGTVSA